MKNLVNEFNNKLITIKTDKYYCLNSHFDILNKNTLCIKCDDLTKWEVDEAFRVYKHLKSDIPVGYRSHFRTSFQMNDFITKLKKINNDFIFKDYCCDGGGVMINHRVYTSSICSLDKYY